MNLELARGAGSRYLVQRWGDGTYCDKTGRKREVEIQAGPPFLSDRFSTVLTCPLASVLRLPPTCVYSSTAR